MKTNKQFALPYKKGGVLLVILIAVVVIAVSGIGYLWWREKLLKIPTNAAANLCLSDATCPPGSICKFIHSETGAGECVKSDLPSSTNPTANWKTYSDDKYGFEIKYPGNLETGACPDNRAGLSCANGAKDFIGPLGLSVITNQGDNNEAEFFFNGYFQGTKTGQSGFEGCSTNTVKNRSATISYVYCPNRPIFTAQIKGNAMKIYVLGSNWNGSTLVGFTNQNQVNQILSTFKFTGQ